jgi:hypothetical protein
VAVHKNTSDPGMHHADAILMNYTQPEANWGGLILAEYAVAGTRGTFQSKPVLVTFPRLIDARLL